MSDQNKTSSLKFFKRFPSYDEMRTYMATKANKNRNVLCLMKIGESHERRPIEMAIMQKDPDRPKCGVMVEGGIHAREWLSPTTALYLIHHLLSKPRLLKKMDFYIIPCLNPDGYEYSRKCNRMWRKNMNRNGAALQSSWGVDLNRNFPFGYGRAGSSSYPDSCMYRGTCPLSEPESKSLRNALDKFGRNVKLYLSIHCYGKFILYPWGFTKTHLCDEEALRVCAEAGARAMKKAYPKSCFEIGKLSEMMYISSGNSSDYARGAHNIKFSYTMELHGGGTSGFNPGPNKIVRVARETAIGIEAMAEHVCAYSVCRPVRLRRCRRRKRKRQKRKAPFPPSPLPPPFPIFPFKRRKLSSAA